AGYRWSRSVAPVRCASQTLSDWGRVADNPPISRWLERLLPKGGGATDFGRSLGNGTMREISVAARSPNHRFFARQAPWPNGPRNVDQDDLPNTRVLFVPANRISRRVHDPSSFFVYTSASHSCVTPAFTYFPLAVATTSLSCTNLTIAWAM